MWAIINLDVECEIDEVNGDEEHVWAKPVKGCAQRRYLIHKDKVPPEVIRRLQERDKEDLTKW